MGGPYIHEKPILFVGSLFSLGYIFDSALLILKENFGNILFQSHTFPWNFSSYYGNELGTPIYRNFVFFKSIIDPSSLTELKLKTKKIEDDFLKNNKRQINLDPGYLTLAKVVLASTKNYSHRIYLGKGIYAELALFYRGKRFIALPYTYKDYRDETSLNIFMEARKHLIKYR